MNIEAAKQATSSFLEELENIGESLGYDIPLVKQASENPDLFYYLADLMQRVSLTPED